MYETTLLTAEQIGYAIGGGFVVHLVCQCAGSFLAFLRAGLQFRGGI